MAPGHARHGGRNDGSWLDDQRTAQLSRARHVFGYLGCTQTSVLTTRCDTSRQLRDTTTIIDGLDVTVEVVQIAGVIHLRLKSILKPDGMLVRLFDTDLSSS